MPESAAAQVIEVPGPEPGLTKDEIIARAQALIPTIRDQQDEAEKLGHHTAALDHEFVTAGFYRMLQPRRFGGYEFDMPTFWKAMIAVSAGDPGTGWGLTLGTHHALVVGAYFPEDGQREIFGPTGEFRCPARAAPMGTAEQADGGFVVSGTWDYCSGIAHATHFMGNALVRARRPGRAGEHRGGHPARPGHGPGRLGWRRHVGDEFQRVERRARGRSVRPGAAYFGQQLDADDRACPGHEVARQPAVLRPDLRRLSRRAGDPGHRRGPRRAG
jgi:hypothetical protein